jgi:D-tyrosyl-tRNA(Tyr) deacylase
MRLLIQRVKQASVKVDQNVVGSIGKGALVLLGIAKEDDASVIPRLVNKLLHLRMFDNPEGKMDLSLSDVKGEVLLVSQFTLYGNCDQGRRPDFTRSAPRSIAEPLYQEFIKVLNKEISQVATGIFGAHMEVALVNDGPVTLILDSK